MKIVKTFFIFVLVFSLVTGVIGNSIALALPDDPVMKYKNLHLWVNPEYDNPRLLVMMQGQLDGLTAPTTVSFLVPSTAEMYSAGSIDTAGNYTGGPPTRAASSITGWDKISYTVTSDTFRVEYYDDVIKGLPEKTIAYEFKTLYPITLLTIFVQQPKTATNFTVNPSGSVGKDAEGFTIQTFSFPNVSANLPIQLNITYTKADNTPSLPTNGTPTPPKSSTKSSTTAFAIVFLVILLAVIGGVFWLSTGSKRYKKRKKSTVSVTRTSRNPTPKPAKKNFCPECGEPTESTKFCPNCGTKL